MYADDTMIYCVGESVAKVTGLTVTMNRVLGELTNWWKHNSPVLHSKNCEGMILHRINFGGLLGSLKIDLKQKRRVVFTTDNKLT